MMSHSYESDHMTPSSALWSWRKQQKQDINTLIERDYGGGGHREGREGDRDKDRQRAGVVKSLKKGPMLCLPNCILLYIPQLQT